MSSRFAGKGVCARCLSGFPTSGSGRRSFDEGDGLVAQKPVEEFRMSEQSTSKDAKKGAFIGCAVFAGLLVLLMIAISGPHEEVDKATGPLVSWPEVGEGLAVSRKEFEARGLVWPLDAEDAVIGCKGTSVIWIEVDGNRYALNGAAKAATSYPDFDVIWTDNPDFPANVDRSKSKGPKIIVDDLFQIGEMQCHRS
jgi:hypothetical protein